jgi:hypothetical protein
MLPESLLSEWQLVSPELSKPVALVVIIIYLLRFASDVSRWYQDDPELSVLETISLRYRDAEAVLFGAIVVLAFVAGGLLPSSMGLVAIAGLAVVMIR